MSNTLAADFVHLHVHSEYSLLDGATRIQELVKAAASKGMKSLALTDHGVMYGTVAFYKACQQHGIKPIIGCEIYYTAGSRFEKGSRKDNPIYHLILLAMNEQGYRNLMNIVTIAQLEGNHYRPRADEETLRAHAEGIICLSACLGGEVNQKLLHGTWDDAVAAALRYKDIYGDRFYLELQDHGILEQKRAGNMMIELAEQLDIPLVATNDVHYLSEQDAEVQDVLICIGTGKTLKDEDRMKIDTDQLYLKSGEEMVARFQHVPQAIANTKVIADRCELTLSLGRAKLPQFWPIPEAYTSASFLKSLCVDGLLLRYGNQPRWIQDTAYRQHIEQRLNYELGVIERMGYSDYFLIVWDFIRFAKERKIAVGPGRGSSAGSLVAYTLSITDVDPIKFNLIFERFLNPERVSMPDIDIDFDDERRDEVIHYVAAKYGESHVAQIITFGTMAAKAAIRDVGRVMNVSFQEVDRAAKQIPNGVGMTIESALQLSPQLSAAYEQQATTKQLIDMAMKVEGMPRHSSTHAAGVVIASQPLTDYTPLQYGSEQLPLTQYSMEHLEAIGLLKMDFLGLRTLSILERSHRWVEKLYGKTIDFHSISVDDPTTYELLGKGVTTGVFQLESAGMRRVLKEMKPSTFEDIVSVLALYRPGPMEFIPKYIEGKHGKIIVEYPHDELRHILQDTYGIIVYQEQIMQIASHMAGFSLGEADLLRRAVSKKKREVLDEERTHFVKGSLSMGYDEQTANDVYDMIVRFADYGFPRAHAVAYAVLAFRTAWFKAHYPSIFMASMLASVAGNLQKTAQYVDECRRMGIMVLPPNVNDSHLNFAPAQDGIRFGLSAIKNVGTQAIESIVKGRQEGPYESLLDFCKRVDLRVVNKRVLESLILAGAFDGLDGHRAQLFAVLDDCLEAVTKWKKQRDELQLELFGFDEIQNWNVELPDIRPFTKHEQLEHEYELLGMYLTGHPLDELLAGIEGTSTDQLVELYEKEDGSYAVVPVRVVSLRSFVSKSGQAMAFAEVEDALVRLEAVIFNRVWSKHAQLLSKDKLALMLVELQKQEEELKLIVHDVAVSAEGNYESLRTKAERLRSQANWRSQSAQRRSTQPKVQNAPSMDRSDKEKTDPSPMKGNEEKVASNSISSSQQKADVAHTDSAQAKSLTTDSAQAASPKKQSLQKVYIKLRSDRQNQETLAQLQRILRIHHGEQETVLFYEGTGQIVVLSDQYSVQYRKQLVDQVEQLLGEGAIATK